MVAAEQEHDPGARADAADTDDLAGHVDVAEALEQLSAVGRQRTPVGADDVANELVEPVMLGRGDDLLDRDDQRRVAGDPRLAVDDLGELRESLQAVLRLRLGHVALEPLDLLPAALLSGSLEVLHSNAGVPEIEVAHFGEASSSPPGRSASRWC